MRRSEPLMDHEDPFHGGKKASLAAFTYAISMMPWMAICPFLPFLIFLCWNDVPTTSVETWVA